MSSQLHWSDGILPVLDFETTGVDPRSDRIVTAALYFTTPAGNYLDCSVDLVVDPGIVVPDEVAAIHGYTTQRVREEGVPPGQALELIVSRLEGARLLNLPLVMYNAGFDWPLLHAECQRHRVLPPKNMYLIDPLVIDRKHDRFRKGKRKLHMVAQFYGVQLVDAHTAADDAYAAADLARRMARRFPEFRDLSLESLQDLQREYHQEYCDRMNEFFRTRNIDKSINDPPWPGV